MPAYQISPLIKFLGEHFFTWSMPLIIMCLNVLKEREFFELNVLIALCAGLAINYLWKLSFWLVSKSRADHKKAL